MTELEVRQKFVSTARKWLGLKEADGSFKPIIDLYNTQRPLPRGYHVKYTDEWCATYVTAVGIKAGLQKIILPECGCSKMVNLYNTRGLWMERDDYVPRIGDIVMYYWKDGLDYATTDCTAPPNHVGIVMERRGNLLTIIEGNKGESVSTRYLQVNGRYIRGYCLPDFKSMATPTKKEETVVEKIYAKLGDIPPAYRKSVEKVMRKGYFGGYSDPNPNSLEDNVLNVSETFCRLIKVMDNAGAFD